MAELVASIRAAHNFDKGAAARRVVLAELFVDSMLGAFACLVLAGLVLILRWVLARTAIGGDLRAPLTLTAVGLLFGAADGIVRSYEPEPIGAYLDAVFFGAVAIGLARIVLTLFIAFYIRRRSGAAMSAIFRDIASLLIYFLVIVVVLRTTLQINIASLIATSAVLTAIIGLALQDVLSNVFSGLVLEIEQPFSRGDWVRIGSFEGVVEETGWRTTKLRTRVNELITLPNSTLSKEAVVNYSRPDPLHGDTLRFLVGYETPPSLVQDAVAVVFAAEPAVRALPELEVRFERFDENGALYAIRYWITEFNNLERIRNRLHTNLWYAFRRAGIRVPFPARDLFVYPGQTVVPPGPLPDVFTTLRTVPLLAPLSDDVLRGVVPRVRRMTFGRGEVVVREGDPGDSFYVIESGQAAVVLGEAGQERPVARLAAGSFFGEMSLLAGDPRHATVRASADLTVLMIDRAGFAEVIVADPALVAPLSQIVSRREAELAVQREQLLASARAAGDDAHAHGLSDRIRAFFGLT